MTLPVFRAWVVSHCRVNQRPASRQRMHVDERDREEETSVGGYIALGVLSAWSLYGAAMALTDDDAADAEETKTKQMLGLTGHDTVGEVLAEASSISPPGHSSIRGLDCHSLLGWPRILSFIEQNERTVASSLTCAGFLHAANAVWRTGTFDSDQLVVGGALSLHRFMRAHARFPALSVQTLSFFGCKQLTNDSIVALAASCPLLKSVNLAFCSRITDASVVALTACCPWLKSVDLTDCELITDASIMALARSCPRLESVNLTWCDSELITEIAIVTLMEKYPKLTSVGGYFTINGATFTGKPGLTDAIVAQFMLRPEAAELEIVNLSHCWQITDVSILMLAKSCAQLTSVNLYNCPHITDASVVFFAASSPRLESVNLKSCWKITVASIVALVQSCPRLQSVASEFRTCGGASSFQLAAGAAHNFAMLALAPLALVALCRRL